MTSYEVAFGQTMVYEGGLVNDSMDPGRMTYMGISRRYWPKWEGWGFIDILNRNDVPLGLSNPLTDMVKKFYRDNYWVMIYGDLLAVTSDMVAFKVFDMSVLLGVEQAVCLLQDAVNLLNRNEHLYQDIEVDGRMGPVTLRAFSACVRGNGHVPLLKLLSLLFGEYLIERMRANHNKEKYVGWITRA